LAENEPELIDDGSGTIYLTGIGAKVKGTIFMIEYKEWFSFILIYLYGVRLVRFRSSYQ